MRDKGPVRIADMVIIILFLTAICTPSVLLMRGSEYKEQSEAEKRTLATLPTLPGSVKELKALPQQFEHYLNDHFGLRQFLVKCYSRLMIAFGSPPSDKVIVGKNGWLFFTIEGLRVIEGYRNIDLLSPQELEAWRLHLVEKQQWLKEQGVAYMFVIAPNKHTIYSEHLPDRIRKVGTKSRYDQLVEYVRSGSDVEIVDLRGPLFEGKNQTNVFYQRDTHWNAVGASIAQHEIGKVLKTFFPHITPLKIEIDQFVWEDKFTGDLVTMAALGNGFKEWKPIYRPFAGVIQETDVRQAKTATETGKRHSIEKLSDRTIITRDSGSNIKALVIGDSFAQAMAHLLVLNFDQTVFVWQRQDFVGLKKLVQEEKPDVVIEETVERCLGCVPYPTSAFAEDYWGKPFLNNTGIDE